MFSLGDAYTYLLVSKEYGGNCFKFKFWQRSLVPERERERELCPNPNLRVVSAQLGRMVGRPLGRVPGEGMKEDFVYLFAFYNVSNAGILITLFTQLFSKPYL